MARCINKITTFNFTYGFDFGISNLDRKGGGTIFIE